MPPSSRTQPSAPAPLASDRQDPAQQRLGSLLNQLKQLETEKKKLLSEFEKRRQARERQQRGLLAERARTERRMDRLDRYLILLKRATERIQRILLRLKLIQSQQERLAEEILTRLGRATIENPGEDRPRVSVPRRVTVRSEILRSPARPFPALPGRRKDLAGARAGLSPAVAEKEQTFQERTTANEQEGETLTAQEAAEAKAALLAILQDIHAFREKREEIEKEVDRLKHL